MAFGCIVLLKDKTTRGPFTRRQIQDGLSRGEFSARDLAHTPGLKEWLPLLEVLHHLDREVVHIPRVRETRDLPPVPDLAKNYTKPALSSDLQEIESAALPELPTNAPNKVQELAGRTAPPVLPAGSEAKGPTSPPQQSFEPAPMMSRIGAWFIDWLILFLPILLIFGVAYGIWLARGSIEHRDAETTREEQELMYRNLRDLVLLVANGFAWLYAAGLESSSGQGTIGKQIMGLVVVDDVGHRISFVRATGRHAARYLSALPFFLGFIVALFNRDRLTWHDRLSGTRVTRRKKL